MSDRAGDPDRRQIVAALVKAERARQGLSVSAVVEKSKSLPDAKLGRTRWTQIESADGALASPATLGKVARVLMLDSNVLLAAAGYLPQPIVTTNYDELLETDLTQLIVDMTEALQELRGEIRSMGTDLRSLVVTFQPQSPDVVPRRQHTLREARQRDVRSRTQDQDSRP